MATMAVFNVIGVFSIVLLLSYQCNATSIGGQQDGQFECPTDRGYYPHDVLCHAYYICYQKEPYLTLCPPKELFNDEILQCADHASVDCGKRNRPDITPDATTLPPISNSTSGSNSTVTPPPSNSTSGVTNTTVTPTPSGNSTSGFDNTTLTPTPSGNSTSGFDNTTLTPTQSDNSTATGSISTVSLDTNTNSTGRPTQPTKPTTTEDPDDDEEVECPEANGYFPHPKNKHRYIVCQGWYPIVMKCPHNLVFDPVLQVCNFAKQRK